jgi:hypothetical protein
VIRLKKYQKMIKNALSSIFFCCLDTERGNTSANGLASTWPSGPKPGFQEAHWNKRICCCAVTKHLFKLDIGRHVEYPKPCALSEMWHIIIYNYIIIYIYISIYIYLYIYVQFDLYCIIGFYVFLPGHHKTIAMHEFTNKTREKTPVETLKPLLTHSADE